MKTKALLTLGFFVILALSACAKPPQELVVKAVREDVSRRMLIAAMYGGEGTGIQRITITKERNEEISRTTVYIFEYEAEFRYVSKLRGERDRLEKITGRVSFYKSGGRWERYE